MRSLLALTISALALTGCVTENSYDGNDKPVVENKINNTGAARTRIALALEYLSTGNSSQAKYNLERAASFSPDLPEVHYSFAYYYQQVGENVQADKAYQKAIKIDPNDPNTRNNYGVFLCGIDEYDRATEQLLKAIAIPSYIRVAESYENLALCAIEFDDFDNAEKYFKSAINHSSMRASSLISLAALYYAKSDLHRAKEILERYENSGQVSSRSLLLSYLVEQRMGHIEKAETTAAMILQTYPTSSEAGIIREQKIKRSEFEILRSQYRQAKLDELQANSPAGEVISAPKIRIVKKKKAPATSTSAQSITTPTMAVKNNNASSNELTAALLTSPVAPTQSTASQSSQQSQATVSTPVDTSGILAALSTTAITTPVQTNVDTTAVQISAPANNNDPAAVMSALVVAQTPNNPAVTSTQATDIASLASEEAVAKALAIPTVHLATAPTATAATPPQTLARSSKAQDGVKIVSFGAPTDSQAVANNSQASTPSQAQFSEQLTDDEKVVFYQPKRNAAVFAESGYSSTPEIRFQDPQQNTHAPLLNSRIPQLTTPYHVLQDGENLFSISVRYNVKLQKLLQWNGLKESDRVVNGTKIFLNDPNIYYEINVGDTLYSIATKRRLLIDQLMRWNKLSPDVALKPGHRLLLVDPESYSL
ncbi:type IV pilus biogenesis/stability protein PilW [Pseudoalteromonas sp. SG44-8]|uniref:type IV pilus biogenesis/stability protein PilW n=1 Tax=Pseudoalteromonas sp. SG44-8 TaxID=2760958 RepID=UPI0015FED48F|nr:type IV pilus biogenesis/stability protein PilW [Pseudoalteromonas sp. SG44-8]MBB1396029.1 type IV pilus biogenesis/stability protein PilW [Pseudoalteromonas sp. SG44-8]